MRAQPDLDPHRAATGKRRSLGRRLLKVLGAGFLALLLAGAAFIAATVIRYQRVVTAAPGEWQTGVQPGARGRWVNPFIGTGGYPWVCGNNFPGAMIPFGMVRLGPETRSFWFHRRALNTSGYYYGDPELLGFSHTRLNGTGATDGGHVLVMPATTALRADELARPRAAAFSHREEVASPGYYAVRLHRPDVLVELTATPRVGLHRYTFAGSGERYLTMDVANALGGRRSEDGLVRVLPSACEVEGAIRTFGTFAGRYGGIRVYFVARFDRPFRSFATWRDGVLSPGGAEAEGVGVGVDLAFGTAEAGGTVTLRLAISHVSVDNARANLEAETSSLSFEAAVASAQAAWEEKLSLVRVQGGTDRQRTMFYTALYRVFQMPTVFNDANGEYVGFDRRVHRADGFRYFTDMSLWDTFRTTHPLYCLIAPQDQRDMVVSLVTMLAQGGWLPRWPAGHGYSNSMLGTPADIVVAETYLKGIRDFEVAQAYEGMKRTALAPTPPGAAFSGRQGVEHYLQYRYCPRGLVRQSVSRTLEFGWADHAISRLAEARGLREDAARFAEHARYYRHLWNPGTQYFQPRDAAGRFHEPFKPLLLTYLDRTGEHTKDYVEGSALQWRWGAFFDAEGMIALFRSREYFVEELEAFFARSSPARGAWNPGPYYWHGNQPDIHAAYLFNAAGRPDLTRKWVHWILDHKYGDGYEGLDGNDDGGTLSAWYVFSALGFYPVAGSDRYELGAPLFERAEVSLGTNRLIIVAENHAPGRCSVSEVRWNDVPLDRTWIRHGEIAQGGVLRFVMASDAGAR